MPFSEGLAAVSPVAEKSKHFITRNGQRAFSGEYVGTECFDHERCLVSTLKTIAYIDLQGRTVWEGPYVSRV
jgi:hypothetical protein